MYTNGLKDRFGSPLVSQRDINVTLSNYLLKSEITTSLSSFVLKTELTTTLNNYVTTATYNDFVSTTNEGLQTVTTNFNKHTSDTTAHITSDEHTSLTELITNKDDYARQSQTNTFTDTNTFKKTIDADGGLESQGDVIVKDGNIIVDKNASITFVDEGEIQITKVASGYIYQTGIPSELDNGKVFDLGVIDSDKDLSSIAFCGDDTIIQTCEIWFHMGETVYSITWPSNTWWIDSATGVSPTWAANMRYRIAFRKEIDTIVASLSYSYTKTV